MDFLPHSQQPPQTPKNLYPCLAHITVASATSEPKAARRLSTGSFGSDSEGGNALTRVISGGRRMSSFGGGSRPSVTGDTGGAGSTTGGRRLSFGGSKDKDDELKGIEGKWYWRVQAGVTDTHLVLLPLTQPPNPVLTTPPAPLSHAMPTHSNQPAAGSRTEGGAGGQEEDGLVAKVKSLFRRSSTTTRDTSDTVNADTTTSANTATTGTEGIQERVIDQTPKGEMLPSASANAAGATNLNSSAELGWPGIVHGEKLGAILIPLGAVEKTKVNVSGGKKGGGTFVSVPINSHFSQIVHPMLDPVGQNKGENFPKSGLIKFEFDKDWIGAKAEAELLHHHITSALSSLPEQAKERAPPQLQEFQLGGGNSQATQGQTHGLGHGLTGGHNTSGYGSTTSAGAPILAPVADTGAGLAPHEVPREVAPDESLGSVSSGGKVAGSAY